MEQNEQTTNSHGGFKSFIRSVLTHRFFPLIAAVVSVILTLPSLKAGLFVDDYHHKLLMQGSESPISLLSSPIDMFRFIDGNPQHTAEIVDYGLFPWWTFTGIKGAFWRPLASLTHWLDYLIWPDSPALMHAQSILWFGALVIAVALLYRRFITTVWIAGLAALLYAIDDAHSIPAGFLASRNAVLATLFGVLAIIAHDRWRRNGWRMGIVLGPLLLAASLLSAEAGIATCAYLVAHAVFIDRQTLWQRCKALIPYACVVVIWRILWTYLGYGVENIGIYVDPLSEPLRFMSEVINRAPLLLLGQWALPPSDISILLHHGHWILLWRGALVFLALLAVVLAPLLRRDRTARFWALGTILSVLPICATNPSNRLLLFVGIGAMGLLAQFFFVVFGSCQWRPKLFLWRIPAVLLALLFILVHLIIAPLVLPVRSVSPMMPKKFIDTLQINTPLDDSVQNQDLIVVNPPVAFFIMPSLAIWESNNQPVPRHTRVLTSSLFRPVKIHRPDAKTLVVRPEYGYLAWVGGRLFRSEQHPFSLGERVELTGMTVEITELTPDNRPAEAAFRFEVPLEDSSLRWLQWKDGVFIPFTPPGIGESVELGTFSQPED